MSDSELETKSNKSFDHFMQTGNIDDYKTVDDYRNLAAEAHELSDKIKNKKGDV